MSVLRAVVQSVWWLLAGAGALVWLVGRLVWAVLAVAGRAVMFAAEALDELVTASTGCTPVLARLRRWWWLVVSEWRARRSGAVDGEVMDGVWR